ncbi:hepatocyte cell adhesion molecule isoform X2 [Scyliorhinus canicula]|uniref:hepatocyte cell adhesion molecule isoform X2 n=1 Tax=Scyliorhinus canicula TaxID=7830 RepID=UPI0018F429FF|nr:hepatocyte cell adhesion molecule isoform X2 [Scyliorhinus canicula]
MQPSCTYLTSIIILFFGQQQQAFPAIQVTGFLHQPVCLAGGSRSELSSVQTINWHKGGQTILQYDNNETESSVIFPKYKEHVSYIVENNSLLIHQLNLQDEGEYKITITLQVGIEKVTFINLTVLVPVTEPRITVQTQDPPHPKLTMNCTVNNGSNPKFSWMKDNKTLLTDRQFQLSTDHRTLGIINLTSSVCGTYICSVQNPVNKVKVQQLITNKHFQECSQPFRPGQRQVLGVTVAVLCVMGFIAVFLAIKKCKEQRRELRLRENLSGEEDQFEEDEIQNEDSQPNMSSSGEGTQRCLYTYLQFIPSSTNQEDQDPSYYYTIGPQV